jgi:SAM-dependent methyltransferase
MLEKLTNVLLCAHCGSSPKLTPDGAVCQCSHPPFGFPDRRVLVYDSEHIPATKAEMNARDVQAPTYLRHGKFPIQIYRIDQFLHQLAAKPKSFPVLDLGCGPGPTTAKLLTSGFDVVGVDFSIESLRINQRNTVFAEDRVLFVVADLNQVRFRSQSVGGLFMADFLQHLGTLGVQAAFLRKAFEALIPGGWFFLSVFNTNLKNILKRDVYGSFSEGAIKYIRLRKSVLLDMLPGDVVVTKTIPTNLFKRVALDRLASRVPGAHLLARWLVLYGYKRPLTQGGRV